MGTIGDRMETTAQHVLASRQARQQAMANLRADVGELLSTYRRDRRVMESVMSTAREQRRRMRLEASHAESESVKRMIQSRHRIRTRAAHEQRAALAADHQERSRSVAALMQNFDKLQSHAVKQLHESLKAFVHDTQVEMSNFIKKAHASRKSMERESAQELRRATMAIRRRTREIEADTRKLLTRLSAMRRDMARQQENHLVASVQDRRRAVAHLLDSFRAAQSAIRMDLRASSRAWRKAGEPVTPMRPHAEPKKIPEAGEKRVAKPEMAAMSHEDQLMEILDVIRRHPEGVSAANIAGIVGLGTLQIGRLATELADHGKVRKDEATRRYFP